MFFLYHNMHYCFYRRNFNDSLIATVNALTALHLHMREECYIHSLKDTSSAGNIRSEHIWIGYEHYMAPKVLTGQKLISGVQVLFFTYCYVVSLLSWKVSFVGLCSHIFQWKCDFRNDKNSKPFFSEIEHRSCTTDYSICTGLQ